MHAARPALAALFALATHAACAANRDSTLAGSSFTIDSPCAHHVEIRPDAGLHGQAAISATADHQEELDRLLFETRPHAGKEEAIVRTVPAGCWRPEPFGQFDPTLVIVVRVPAGFPVSIDESGAGRYAVGDVGGPLSLDVSGAAHIAALHASTLDIDLSGAGAVTLARAEGAADIKVSGHGSVAIAQAAMPKLDIDLSGAGSVTIENGKVGSASVDESGFGQVSFGGEVGDAKVDISGAGSVHFGRLTGALEKDVSGAGSVSVGP